MSRASNPSTRCGTSSSTSGHRGMKDPFEGVDRVEYRAYVEPLRMARSYRSFTRDVKRLIEKRGGLYHAQTVEGNLYNIPVLPPEGGPRWFIVEFYALPEQTAEAEAKPVELLFLFENLYLLGFRVYGETVFHLFSDASKEGLSKEQIAAYTKDIGFGGNYGTIGQNYEKLCIGYTGQVESFDILSRYSERDANQLKRALCRKLDMAVFPGELYKQLSFHFTSWGSYCQIIRSGEAGFKEEKPVGFQEFEELLSFVGLMLHLKQLGIKVFVFRTRLGSKVMLAFVIWPTRDTKVNQTTTSQNGKGV